MPIPLHRALCFPKAKENLLALLKHMYRQLFAWINWKINVVFDAPTAAVAGQAGAGAERTFIGILDIFGEAGNLEKLWHQNNESLPSFLWRRGRNRIASLPPNKKEKS